MAGVEHAKRVHGMQSIASQEIPHSRDGGTVDLGNGSPDFPPPEFVTAALQLAISDSTMHQYTRDLVILIEPYFEYYEAMIRMAEGVPVFAPLRPINKDQITSSDWLLDMEDLASKFNSRTKMIILNTPHNLLGKVFSRGELEMISRLCIKHNVICVMDEAYEWIIFEGATHSRMNTLSGMWERTITIGSVAPTFGVFGWKIGWAYGPRSLLRGLRLVHQNFLALVSTLLQEAASVILERTMEQIADHAGYLGTFLDSLQQKRDFMCSALKSVGILPAMPDGGYFIVCDFSAIGTKFDLDGNESKDYLFTKWLASKKNLRVVPLSTFYSVDHKHLAEDFIRISFVKKDSTLQKAAAIFMELAT
ncbi:kynurenine aminotransferase-like isoform X3 [Dermacentor silvarum]|uniref:kynurenine aminotransferase-like isoform X3 n=1 Tax=Dermacentor silvarum TaxID=543639 RepID=UPI00210151E4|nr:kynurenine aminotransferase-like isoform X3 [Dermacentor silvarum]